MKLLRLLMLATIVQGHLFCVEDGLSHGHRVAIHNFIANLNVLDYAGMSSAFVGGPSNDQLRPLADERERTGPYITMYELAPLGTVGPVQVGYISSYDGPVVSVHIKVVGDNGWLGVLSVELAETESGVLVSSLHIEKGKKD